LDIDIVILIKYTVNMFSLCLAGRNVWLTSDAAGILFGGQFVFGYNDESKKRIKINER